MEILNDEELEKDDDGEDDDDYSKNFFFETGLVATTYRERERERERESTISFIEVLSRANTSVTDEIDMKRQRERVI